MQWRIGCCGFPKGRQKYFSQFKVVEVQQTFYRLPKKDLALDWRADAPQSCEFVLKAPQLITHLPTSPTYRRLGETIPAAKQKAYGAFRPTAEVKAARRRIETMARQLGSALLLYQCPPSFNASLENIKNLKRFFARPSPAQCALELRGSSWEATRVRDLCAELNVIPVVDPLVHEALHGADVAYFRLHGIPAYRYGYFYEPADLRALYQRLFRLPVSTCYVLFNNFRMFEDAVKFQALCRRMDGRKKRLGRDEIGTAREQ